MNDVVSVLQTQTDALLQHVSREQESRERVIRQGADEQSRAIVVRARQEARARLRQALDEERRQIERAIGERRAALETAARRAEQATLRALIERAWERLPHSVAARWQDPAAREQWIAAACTCASRGLLPQASYVVEIDANCAGAVVERVQAVLAAAGFEPVAHRAVEGLGAGLRIRGGSACVDATVAGLLASRERVEAELLAEFDRVLEEREQGASP